jgi:hypothetical protein
MTLCGIPVRKDLGVYKSALKCLPNRNEKIRFFGNELASCATKFRRMSPLDAGNAMIVRSGVLWENGKRDQSLDMANAVDRFYGLMKNNKKVKMDDASLAKLSMLCLDASHQLNMEKRAKTKEMTQLYEGIIPVLETVRHALRAGNSGLIVEAAAYLVMDNYLAYPGKRDDSPDSVRVKMWAIVTLERAIMQIEKNLRNAGLNAPKAEDGRVNAWNKLKMRMEAKCNELCGELAAVEENRHVLTAKNKAMIHFALGRISKEDVRQIFENGYGGEQGYRRAVDMMEKAEKKPYVYADHCIREIERYGEISSRVPTYKYV